MAKNKLITVVLAVLGTFLVWLPILAPGVFGLIRFIESRRFNFDYLMPAEFFPLVFVGGALLQWAALREHHHQKLIGWSLGSAAAALAGSMLVAQTTGLASGATEPVGLPWISVLALLVVYIAAVISMGIGGLLVARSSFRLSAH